MTKRVCIVGGGISGLTVAYLLSKRGIDVILFERSDRCGGNVRSERRDGFLIEHGPNSLLRSPKLIELIGDLGLRERVLPAAASAKNRFVLAGGKLRTVPDGLAPFVFGNYFSLPAKIRLLGEPFIRSKSAEDETVAGFIERRLGREIVEKAADPFIGGIFAGDPYKLCIRSSFPRLFDLEREFGSLLMGMLRSKRERADPTFPRTFSFTGGVQCLTEQLREQLGELVVSKAGVDQVRTDGSGGLRVVKDDGSDERFEAVVISTKADSAASMLFGFDSDLAEILKGIYYAPVAVVHSGYRNESLADEPEGFGFLVPSSEKRRILGSIWNSSVFPDRAPAGYHLFTTFLGGTRDPNILELGDEDIAKIVHDDLANILKISREPEFINVTRWKTAIPQYEIGHSRATNRIDKFTDENRGMFICSNFYRGISVGDCVKNAYAIADKVEDLLKD